MAQLETQVAATDGISFSVPRLDAHLKVTGRVTYTRDMKLPGMLYARVKRSPYPHAKILSIDSLEAEKVHGVKAIITSKDFPKMMTIDTPALAEGEVLYWNQSVAAVAARDPLIAEEALSKIKVQYEELPGIFDPEAAMSKASPVMIRNHGIGPNIARYLKVRNGDVEAAFSEADRVIENHYTTAVETHLQLEPLSFLAQPDPDGGVTVWSTTGGAARTQLELAKYLGMDPHLIRAKVGFLGGWFGEKEQSHMAAVCAKLALKSSRPVKLDLSREETITASAVKHPARIAIKDGLTKQGRIIARQIRAIYDGGAYSSVGNEVLEGSIFGAVCVYDIPNVKIDAYRVYTNRVPGAAKAAIMAVPMVWAVEGQMDRVASALNLDPVELRRRNLLRQGRENAIGEILEGCDYEKIIFEVAKAIQMGKKALPRGPWKSGKGFAVASKWVPGGTTQATVRLTDTGKVEVWVEIVENGAGSQTGIAQIVATELGVPIKDIVLMPFVQGSDSTITGLAEGATACRQLVFCGSAIILACKNLKKRVAERAASVLGIPPERIEVNAKIAFDRNDPKRSVSISDLIPHTQLSFGLPAWVLQNEFVGYGVYSKQRVEFDRETGKLHSGPVPPSWVSVVQGAEVSVNTETGHVRVHRIVAAMDVGKAINPELLRAQIRGQVMMGLSAALSEELVVSEGRIVNANLADYKVLTVVDAPEVEPIIMETPYEFGPYGAKPGAGNASILPVASAIRSAIHDAVGVWVDDLPITPQKVLDAIVKDSADGADRRGV